MQDTYKDIALIDNPDAHQFELPVGEYLAKIVYKRTGDKVYLLHTEVSPELEGKGAATAVIEKTLADIEGHHLKLIPRCPFVIAYLKRHPDWKRILHEDEVDNIFPS